MIEVRAMDSLPTEWEKLMLTTCGRYVEGNTFTRLAADNRNDLELWLLENMDRLPCNCRFNEDALPRDIPYLHFFDRLRRPVGAITGKFKVIGATRLACRSSKTAQILSLLFMNVRNHECLLQVQPLGTQKAEGRACKRAQRKAGLKKDCAKEIHKQTGGSDELSEKECCDRSKNKCDSLGARACAASASDAANASVRKRTKAAKTTTK